MALTLRQQSWTCRNSRSSSRPWARASAGVDGSGVDGAGVKRTGVKDKGDTEFVVPESKFQGILSDATDRSSKLRMNEPS